MNKGSKKEAVSMGNGLIANSWTVGLLERKGICMLILIN